MQLAVRGLARARHVGARAARRQGARAGHSLGCRESDCGVQICNRRKCAELGRQSAAQRVYVNVPNASGENVQGARAASRQGARRARGGHSLGCHRHTRDDEPSGIIRTTHFRNRQSCGVQVNVGSECAELRRQRAVQRIPIRIPIGGAGQQRGARVSRSAERVRAGCPPRARHADKERARGTRSRGPLG